MTEHISIYGCTSFCYECDTGWSRVGCLKPELINKITFSHLGLCFSVLQLRNNVGDFVGIFILQCSLHFDFVGHVFVCVYIEI